MIINIRGTNGSGKTYFARTFLETFSPNQEVYGEERKKPVAHVVFYNMIPVYVIGSYNTVCGGCDTLRTQDMVSSLVRHFSQLGHVIYEGILVSRSVGRYIALDKELSKLGIPTVFAFLNTPYEVCLSRIRQRRTDKGNDKELDPANAHSTYVRTISTRERFKEEGCDMRIFQHDSDPIKQLTKVLDEHDLSFKNSYREETFR